GVTVALVARDHSRPGLTKMTNDSGLAAFSDLLQGEYTVTVSSPGWQTYSENVTISRASPTMLSVRLLPPGMRSEPYRQLTDDELDACETVFRYQFHLTDVYLSIFDRDPSDAFLARFHDPRPPVHKGSEFRQGKGDRLVITALHWINNVTVEIDGGSGSG